MCGFAPGTRRGVTMKLEKAQQLPRMVSLTELSRKVSATIDKLLKGDGEEQILVMRHNEPAAVLMSATRYERLMATLEAYERAEDERLAAERMHEAGDGNEVDLDEAFAE